MPQEQDTKRTPPEISIGPFSGSIQIAVWKNDVDTANGPRTIRNVTISPRRFKNRDTGEWKDAGYRPTDLPAIILGLQEAQCFMIENPLPEQNEEENNF